MASALASAQPHAASEAAGAAARASESGVSSGGEDSGNEGRPLAEIVQKYRDLSKQAEQVFNREREMVRKHEEFMTAGHEFMAWLKSINERLDKIGVSGRYGHKLYFVEQTYQSPLRALISPMLLSTHIAPNQGLQNKALQNKVANKLSGGNYLRSLILTF